MLLLLGARKVARFLVLASQLQVAVVAAKTVAPLGVLRRVLLAHTVQAQVQPAVVGTAARLAVLQRVLLAHTGVLRRVLVATVAPQVAAVVRFAAWFGVLRWVLLLTRARFGVLRPVLLEHVVAEQVAAVVPTVGRPGVLRGVLLRRGRTLARL